jgi:hypothetical protein
MYWNLTKGGVGSGLSSYLSSAHSSPFKVLSMETVCWERLIQMALLSTHQMCKFDRFSREDLERHNTFTSIKKASQSGNRTFKHFLSDCMRWACDEAVNLRNAGALADHTYRQLTSLTHQQIRIYYNSEEGRARRSDNRLAHKNIKQGLCGYCCVCSEDHTIPNRHRVYFACEHCPGICLCIKYLQNHPSDVLYNAEQPVVHFTNCFDIFHKGEFILLQ